MYFLWVMVANEAQLSLNRAIRTHSIYSGGVRYDSCKASDKVQTNMSCTAMIRSTSAPNHFHLEPWLVSIP